MNKNSKYDKFIKEIQSKELNRLGFPVSGGVLRGTFTEEGWLPSQDAETIVDLEELGIINNTPASIFLNSVGSPFEEFHVNHHSKFFEKKLIKKIMLFFGADTKNMFGYVTSGGSEGNLAALWWHREYLLNVSKKTKKPILIVSKQSHHSIFKCANMLSYETIVINASSTLGIDLKELEISLIKNMQDENRPIIISLTIGTTKEGCIDDLESLKSRLLIS